MADMTYYDSPLTGAELDAALARLPQLDESVAEAAASAQTARQWGELVEQNQDAIRSVADNLTAITAAPDYAAAAAGSAAGAETACREAEDARDAAADSARDAAASAQQAQQIARGALGWYATPQALQAAHPTGQNGQWAIVGSTDTIWLWDGDTAAWVDAGARMDLSAYCTGAQLQAAVPYLYKATFLLDGWSGDGPWTQTVAAAPMDGGPAIAAGSVMTSALFCDDTVQGEAQDALLEAAALVDRGTKTFGAGTVTCVLAAGGEKPAADAEVWFNARKGGV